MIRPDVSPAMPASSGDRGWLRTALVANLGLQMFIIVSGGLVRLTGSGLGCSEWPQCTPGSFTPVAQQAEGYHSLIEFGNRLITFVLAAVGIAVIYGARRWASDRRRFLVLSTVPLVGILAQAVLGGIIVWSKLDPKTVSPHFLLSVLLIAYSAWLLERFDRGDGGRRVLVHPLIARMTYVACAAAAVVIVLGTAVTGSGPHSGDANEPIRFGFDPRTTSWLHADSVMLFVGLVVAIVVASRVSTAPERFRWWWSAILVICVIQGLIGYTQFFAGLPVALVTLHLLGSAVLTAAVTFGTLAARQRA
jgi:heme a synthase